MRRLDTSYRAFAAAAALAPQPQQEAALRAAIAAYFEQPEAGPEAAQSGAAAAAAGAAAGRADDGAAPAAAGGEGSLSALLAGLDASSLPLKSASPALLHAARAVLRRVAEQRSGGTLGALGLARVLHGLGSPAAPGPATAKLMGSFWGCHAATDFATVLRAAEIAVRDGGGASS